MTDRDRARDLAEASNAADEPTAWFEELYAEGAAGEAEIPWGS